MSDSLLKQIQASLLESSSDLGPMLLKLRFLASKLGSVPLEEWVKFESEGYPKEAELPDYRKVGIHFTGSFSGPFGSGIKNAPLPSYLIAEHAGKDWLTYELRQSVASIPSLYKSTKSGVIQLSYSNLPLLLQGHIYPDYACNQVVGHLAVASLDEVINSVRNRILELTLELEKSVPGSAAITLTASAASHSSQIEQVTNITHQIVHGNVTTITNSGAGSEFHFSVSKSDAGGFEKALVEGGVSSKDAAELRQIVASEKPDLKDEALGPKGREWLVKNIGKAVNGTWKASLSVATSLITEAALRYYGLKS